MNYEQPDFNQFERSDKKRYRRVLFFVLAAFIVIYGLFELGLATHKIEINNEVKPGMWQKVATLFNLSSDKPLEN